MVKAAEESGDSLTVQPAHAWRMTLAVCAGDKLTFDAEFVAQNRLVQQQRQPLHLYHAAGIQAMRAILEGRFAQAEQLAVRAAALGRRVDAETVDGTFGMPMFTIRREQGRLAEVAPVLAILTQSDSSTPLWRPGLALVYAELGRDEPARTELNRLAESDFAAIPSTTWKMPHWPYRMAFYGLRAGARLLMGPTNSGRQPMIVVRRTGALNAPLASRPAAPWIRSIAKNLPASCRGGGGGGRSRATIEARTPIRIVVI